MCPLSFPGNAPAAEPYAGTQPSPGEIVMSHQNKYSVGFAKPFDSPHFRYDVSETDRGESWGTHVLQTNGFQ